MLSMGAYHFVFTIKSKRYKGFMDMSGHVWLDDAQGKPQQISSSPVTDLREARELAVAYLRKL
jgi:hypothetical protein